MMLGSAAAAHTPDSALADSSRTIADLRRKLAECEAERDATPAREAASTEVLEVINSSPSDPLWIPYPKRRRASSSAVSDGEI